MQPTCRQVPPRNGSFSTTLVFRPSSPARIAATYPPGPLPIIATSYLATRSLPVAQASVCAPVVSRISRFYFRFFQAAKDGAPAVRLADAFLNAEKRRIKSRPRYQRRRPCLCESQILAAACLASQPTSLLEFPCFVTPLKVHSTGKNDVENRGTRRREILQERSRSEEHTSELQSLAYLVCRLLLEK